jgi:crossover junction endodeoxyribonuclease RuvC
MSRGYVGIDPSTKTGLVRIDEDGEEWEAREIDVGLNGRDPDAQSMRRLIEATINLIDQGDRVAIEGFGFASQSGFLLGGIGWGIRMELDAAGIKYLEVAPSQLKKFSGAGGTAAKEQVAVEVYKRWGVQYKSNNVTDAYVLAQIARAMHEPVHLIKCQEEVIQKLRGA